ncbi:MAG: 4'-phosphopantetheinyl transferase superfamily protein [Verrucomicrobia bacterium]|nr:4'-phosphopantetheinyl transferase superfamily protein [Verrucomicrobiota bacterium]
MTTRWPTALPTGLLAETEVHLWLACLDVAPETLSQWEQILSVAERARASRFHFEKDRRHYLAAHAILRFLLGTYLKMDPAQLQFAADTLGKPHVLNDAKPSSLSFNLSDSAGLALYGVTRGRRIGVDLEKVRPGLSPEAIAASFFSRGEIRTLRSLPIEQQGEAFFNCWTCKEAFLKARGSGLLAPLDQFEVAFLPGDSPAILHAADDPEARERWTVRRLAPAPGYAAAVVVEGRDLQFKHWQWQA